MGDERALQLCECSEGASPLSQEHCAPRGATDPPPPHKPQHYLVHRCTGDLELRASPGGLHGVFSLVMSGFPQERVTPVPLPLPANPGQAPGRTAHLPQRLTQPPRPHRPWVVGAGGLTLPRGGPHFLGGPHTVQGSPIPPRGGPTLPRGSPTYCLGGSYCPGGPCTVQGSPHCPGRLHTALGEAYTVQDSP